MLKYCTSKDNVEKHTIGLQGTYLNFTVKETKIKKKSKQKSVEKLRKAPMNGINNRGSTFLTYSIRFNEVCYGFPDSQRENI